MNHFKNSYIFIPLVCEVIGDMERRQHCPFLMNSPTKFVQSQAMTEEEISFIRDFLSRYREAMLLAFNVVLLIVVSMLTLLHNNNYNKPGFSQNSKCHFDYVYLIAVRKQLTIPLINLGRKIIRCVLGMTSNSSVVIQSMTVKLRPCLRFRACG